MVLILQHECINYLNKLGYINAYQATIDDLNNTSKRYDFIRLNTILEHIVELNGTIKNLKTLLNPSGYLYISVPNVMKFKDCKNAPFQEFSVEHINYFSINSLTNLMKRH